MELIENKNYDEERALYNIKDTEIDSINEIINEDSIMEVNGKILIREKVSK